MFIKDINIKNFRSLSNLNIEDLGQINIFTGENNSGKTSVLEAFFLLIGWQGQNFLRLNKLRSQKSIIDISYFFNRINTDNIIEISTSFDENDYQRVFKAELLPDYQKIDNQVILKTSIQEKKKFTKWTTTSQTIKIIEGGFVNDSVKFEGKPITDNLLCNFPTFRVFEHDNLIKTLSKLITTKEDEKITNLLKPIDEKIQGIRLVGNNIFLDMVNFSALLPIEVSGDGIRRILSLILAIYGAGYGGYVMIDEIENGLHYTSMPKVWKSIINTAIEMNVQLFITTHNEELLKILSDVVSEEFIEKQSLIRYYNLKRYQQDLVVAYKYDFNKFDYLISNGNEIR